MKHRPYYGDERLKHRVEYSRKEASSCIYCGKAANSREHIPSKIFLDKPYPMNLYLVPACKTCNNSFSKDELYTWLVLKYLEKKYQNLSLSENEERRYQQNQNVLNMVISDIELFISSHSDASTIFAFRSNRIERILEKLARGHMVFELSEGYNTVLGSEWITDQIEYAFRPLLSPSIIDDYDCAIPIQDSILPEVGSRIYENLIPVSIPIRSSGNSDLLSLNMLFLDWVDIQDKRYRYITVFQGNRVNVNIVIDEFLFASICFKRSE